MNTPDQDHPPESESDSGSGTANESRVRLSENATLRWSFCWFFFILLGYFIIRPVRETMGVEGGRNVLSWLFFGTFMVMVFAAPLYSKLIANFERRRLVPIIYRFFSLCLIAFWFGFRENISSDSNWSFEIYGTRFQVINVLFFIWVSVFNMFVVTIFWSFMADIYSSAQGKRFFGIIASGGTLGGLCGSTVSSFFTATLGVPPIVAHHRCLPRGCHLLYERSPSLYQQSNHCGSRPHFESRKE